MNYHSCQTPKEWATCCTGCDLPFSAVAAAFAPAIPLPACLAVHLRADLPPLLPLPSFSAHLLWSFLKGSLGISISGSFLAMKWTFDLLAGFYFLRLCLIGMWPLVNLEGFFIPLFHFSFHHPHMNLVQPRGFFMEFLICCSSIVSCLPLQNVQIYLGLNFPLEVTNSLCPVSFVTIITPPHSNQPSLSPNSFYKWQSLSSSFFFFLWFRVLERDFWFI